MIAKIKIKFVDFFKWLLLDGFKWLIALALTVLAVVGNHYFAYQSIFYRALGVVVIAILAIFVVSKTVKGCLFIQMAKEARAEIRKVNWPTKQETTQTTMIVVVVVLVMALLLWSMDSLLGWLISFIVG